MLILMFNKYLVFQPLISAINSLRSYSAIYYKLSCSERVNLVHMYKSGMITLTHV